MAAINIRIVLNVETFLVRMLEVRWRGIKFVRDKPLVCEPSLKIAEPIECFAILDVSCEIKIIRKTFSLVGNGTLGMRTYLDSVLPNIKEDLERDGIITPLICIATGEIDIVPLCQSPMFAPERLRRCADILRAIDDDPLGIYRDLFPSRIEITEHIKAIEEKEKEWLDHFKH